MALCWVPHQHVMPGILLENQGPSCFYMHANAQLCGSDSPEEDVKEIPKMLVFSLSQMTQNMS